MGCPKSETSLRTLLLAALDRSPSGRTTTSLAREVCSPTKRVAGRLAEMQRAGRLIGVVPKVESGRQIKLWFALQHAEQAAAAGPVGWAAAATKRQTAKRATTIAQAMAPKPMKPAADPVRITAPPFVDRRFTPERVEPFFSAMTPGSYLRTGSAVERAYMERG